MPNYEELAYTPIGDLKSSVPTATSPAIPIIVKSNTLLDYVALKGLLIIANRTNVGSGVNPAIYTVPAGYVFFLIGASSSVADNTTIIGPNMFFSRLTATNGPAGGGGGSYVILEVLHHSPHNAMNQNSDHLSYSPSIPLIFTEDTTFYVYQQSSTITTAVCIQGYLCKKTDIPQIIQI